MRTLQLNQAILGWRRLPALLLCAAALLSAQPRAFAQPDDPVATRRQAAEWLDRIQQAAQQQNYEGTFVYQRGAYVQSSRIVHVATKGDGEYERVESLDGKPRKLLRHNDDLYTFVPERRLCVVERRQNKDSFPALLGASGEQVLSVYEPKSLGRDRVAGLDAQVVELVPKDAYRFAYKLWTDAKTGLLLRSQTLDTDDRVLEQIAFSQLQLGAAAPRPPPPVDVSAVNSVTTASMRRCRPSSRPSSCRRPHEP